MSEPVVPESAQRKPVVMLVGIGLVVLILFGAALLLAPRSHEPAAPSGKPDQISLSGLVVAGDPPHIVRALRADGQLASGEQLRLRARISSPAYLTLLAQRPGSVSEPIWPASPELHDAGEVELEEGDNPLTLDPKLFGAGAVLVMLACPQALPAASARVQLGLTEPASVQQAFPSCAGTVIHAQLK